MSEFNWNFNGGSEEEVNVGNYIVSSSGGNLYITEKAYFLWMPNPQHNRSVRITSDGEPILLEHNRGVIGGFIREASQYITSDGKSLIGLNEELIRWANSPQGKAELGNDFAPPVVPSVSPSPPLSSEEEEVQPNEQESPSSPPQQGPPLPPPVNPHASKPVVGPRKPAPTIPEECKKDSIKDLNCTPEWGVCFAHEKGKYHFVLIPAMASTQQTQHSFDTPNALPGLNIAFSPLMTKHRIPGAQSLFQNMGVDSVMIRMVGAFTGAESSEAKSPRLSGGPRTDPRPSRFFDDGAAAADNDPRGVGAVGSVLDSYRCFQEFYDFAILHQAELTVEINLGRNKDGFRRKEIDSVQSLRAKNGNPRFKGIVRKLETWHARYDRTWYVIDFEVTEFGLSSTKKLKITAPKGSTPGSAESVDAPVEEASTVGPGGTNEKVTMRPLEKPCTEAQIATTRAESKDLSFGTAQSGYRNSYQDRQNVFRIPAKDLVGVNSVVIEVDSPDARIGVLSTTKEWRDYASSSNQLTVTGFPQGEDLYIPIVSADLKKPLKFEVKVTAR